jgi:nucleoside-diphosphate-sugar epimerase
MKKAKKPQKSTKIALVTGANGFIGANLVHALLKRGYEVHAIVRKESNLWKLKSILRDINLHKSDITESKKIKTIVKKVSPHYVFNLAQYGGNGKERDSKETRRVIIEGAEALYDACKEVSSIKSIINAGSSSEYGSKKNPMKEDMLLEPNTPYGVARAWTTLYGQHLAREHGLPIITARLFSIYGIHEHKGRFMSEVTLACLKGEQPRLTDPKTVRDFVFVTDAVDALILMSKKGKLGEIYNIGTGHERTLKEAAELIAKYSGFKEKLNWGTIEGRVFDASINHWEADIRHTRKDLGWKAKYDIESGIKKTVDWFKENRSLYEK